MLSFEEVKSRVKSYGLVEMAEKTGLSRQTLHRFVCGEDIKLSNFCKLLDVLEIDMSLSSDVTDEDVLANLADWGAPVLAGETNHKMSLEETVVASLGVMGRDGRLSSVLAFLLVKKAYQVDWDEVLSNLSGPREYQLLGYVLNLALEFRYRAPLQKAGRKLLRKKNTFQWQAVSERDEGKPKGSFARYENYLAMSWKLFARENPIDAVQRIKKWEKSRVAA